MIAGPYGFEYIEYVVHYTMTSKATMSFGVYAIRGYESMLSIPQYMKNVMLFLLSSASILNSQHQFEYLHPIPGSSLLSKYTTVIVRPGDKILSTAEGLSSLFSVIGSSSGIHEGRANISDDRKTILWKPSIAFMPSETVYVKVREGIQTAAQGLCSGLNFHFVISANVDDIPIKSEQFHEAWQKNGSFSANAGTQPTHRNAAEVSLPSDFPGVKVTVYNKPDSGYIFLSNMWNGNPYLLIFDNLGKPIFYRKIPGNAYDFKVQPNGQLTYYIQSDINRYYFLDSTFTLVDSITNVQGYIPNEHEIRILPNGHIVLIGMDVQTVDMSKVVAGGNPNAKVLGNHILELDAAKNVVFVWRCWDHFPITDGIDANLTLAFFDYVHMNAIEIDKDSNFVISSRNMSEITKISRSTGKILWRLGGKNNPFTFTQDPSVFTFLNKPMSFSYQHCIRVTPNGNYLLFDNGNLRSTPFSRAAEYRIDTLTMTAELVWQFRNTPDVYSAWMGSVQRLPSGSTLIDWAEASTPKATEVRPDGTKSFEMEFVNPAVSYRVNRSHWKGKASAPSLIVEPHFDRTTLLFNTFGDTDVVQYNVFGGLTPGPSLNIAQTGQTSIDLKSLENGKQYYFRATSVDSKGNVSKYSNEESVLVKYITPGENLLLNGNFSQALKNWQLDNYDSADAKAAVLPSGECFLSIKKGGPNAWSVQFLQANLEIVNKKKYVLEFDAYASAQRTIDVKVEKNGSPWTNYSRTSVIALPTIKKHFSFPFTMEQPTDYRARISFNCGISAASVFLDNISVSELVVSSAEDRSASLPFSTILEDNYPNPFNPSTTIRYSIPSSVNVKLAVCDVLGRELAVLVNAEQTAGWKEVEWNASAFGSGVYFYRLTAGTYVGVKKLMLLK